MDARFYNAEDIDIQRLAGDIVNVYLAQGYQAQYFGQQDQVLVQLKKGGDFEAIIGMQAAVSLTIQRTGGGILAMIGQQRWIDKAAVGAVGIVAFPILWPLALTAGAGALRQASLANQVLNVVDGLVRQQRPNIQIGPVPAPLLPQMQQQWGQPQGWQGQGQTPYYNPSGPVVNGQSVPQAQLPPPVPGPDATHLRCTNCNTPYEAGDTFCSGCGRPLTAPRAYCPNCNSELKPGTSFCSRCGTSTFAPAAMPNQPVQPGPVQQPPAYTPPTTSAQPAPAPSTPVYQPPAPPSYTPPVTQTPPATPQPQVYYVPSNEQATEAAPAPAPAPQKPEEPYYVPPVTQEPAVKPQPKVTLVQGTPRQAPPPPHKPRPQKQYYIPSNQTAQQDQDATVQTGPTAPAQTTITARPASQPAYDAQKSWGVLVFADGQQRSLAGERLVIGRYDHDLGGLQPEIDLGKSQGADTISRVHAALEHVGSNYTLTDLNSTNATRINGKRLEPDKAMIINDGDIIRFGSVSCTFKKEA
ncbi:MAG TPA: FHA domain-containing protein [Dictyobacter sp.]|nr:FHA domain-containing protein [Dictyobacter sp.]